MRQVVLAFNFLSVVYAIISGLLILSLTTLVAVDFINVDAIPKTAALFALLLLANIISVSALKRRKRWSYIVCSAHVFLLCAVSVYSMATRSISASSLFLLGLVAVLGLLLYTDYVSGKDVHNNPL
ncbi:hypothetical protein SAMN05216361_3901 [Marisediminitalea aggregata]|jgi:hypothetical protein|uniref:Uncharacterized protein n=1 Tax=Marisediminitalea aggregata TaxID=634436 RepID=A0A1M5QGP8_9ALTE|nr:hypothetical protein [Marisediminitalea aggregata]MAP23604.1 hypothetical protein [Alteromonadaceae bacterium]SHH13335.1 hypothetical protein SAMN05216361_3901 [Marisediminitalea aggregata]|tara:strand:+ start:610 stop:987 length:378 start_codon:yes stop_codon:yes gene_type:complete